MRDIKQLHPDLQTLAKKLITECKKQGIDIKIGECLRTTAEQDKLYSYGRTDKSRGKVTNAQGCTYSSMHQWGVAFDVYLDEDVDKDGKTSDDAFNNKTGLFNKVGKIGQALGLEWGGSWTSIKDLPHFQLKKWGSTPRTLKAKYGTPQKFMKTWK
jgi:peptidoglycan L-alanyl-D-glutamate endopeptidase CwlK